MDWETMGQRDRDWVLAEQMGWTGRSLSHDSMAIPPKVPTLIDYLEEFPHYTTDIAAAMGLLKAMEVDEWHYILHNDVDSKRKHAALWKSRDFQYGAWADTLPAAICQACYEALGGES